jgi:integrase
MNILNARLADYLKLRRQLGFKLHDAAKMLTQFVLFATQEGVSFITTKLALRWATQPKNCQPSRWTTRLGVVRLFAQYLSTIDRRTQIPPPGLLPYCYHRKPPYLYCDEEVLQLVQTAQQNIFWHDLKRTTYATLFGLLAVTGLRVGEALALDQEHVDLDRSLLVIVRAKGNKTRLLPLHGSTQRALRRYIQIRDQTFPRPASRSFFVSEAGTRLLYSSVNWCFLTLARKIGLRGLSGTSGPRLHDLRHYFALRTLLKWYRSNTNVEAHLPELATYLGHTHVTHTYWYLSAAPELLQLATRRWQRNQGANKL